MPFTSNGVYTPPITALYPAQTGAIITASDLQSLLGDMVTALGQCQLRTQVAPAAGPLNMNTFKVSNAANATGPTDLTTLSQVQALIAAAPGTTGAYLPLAPTAGISDQMQGLFKLYGTNASADYHPVPLIQLLALLANKVDTVTASTLSAILTFTSGGKIILDHNAVLAMEPVTKQQFDAGVVAATVVIKELVFTTTGGYQGGYMTIGNGAAAADCFCIQWGQQALAAASYIQNVTWHVAFKAGVVPIVAPWASFNGTGAYRHFLAETYSTLQTYTGCSFIVQEELTGSFTNPTHNFSLNWIAVGKRYV